MWYMGYGPEASLQRTIDVVNYNITYFLGTALPNQACPLAAWNAYWTLRTHGIPTVRSAADYAEQAKKPGSSGAG
jgi:hypothetical protein